MKNTKNWNLILLTSMAIIIMWRPSMEDPQIQFLSSGCGQYVVSNLSSLNQSLNAAFSRLRTQVRDERIHFATAEEGTAAQITYTLFQCRDFLFVVDCLACFDVAAVRIGDCPAGANGGQAIYDGCFLRYETRSFYQDATGPGATSFCGNQTTEQATAFTATAQQALLNLQIATPKIAGFYAATKTQVAAINGPSIYAFAQCIHTISQSDCLYCLTLGRNNLETCLPNSDGRAFDDGCFIRYSTSSIFADNQTLDITPFLNKQGTP